MRWLVGVGGGRYPVTRTVLRVSLAGGVVASGRMRVVVDMVGGWDVGRRDCEISVDVVLITGSIETY